jgi:hypothetical protein
VIEQVSFFGLTRTSCDVRFRAAAKGIADMDHALIRNVSTYEVHALATPQVKRFLGSQMLLRLTGRIPGSSAMTCSLRVSRTRPSATMFILPMVSRMTAKASRPT